MNRLCKIATTLIAALSISKVAVAADWPQFRYDAGRTAAGTEQLPGELHLQWVRELASPAPAFPSNVRLEFDKSYEPVVLGHTMFVPSMITESLTALDTATGAERWRFFAEGPVRFAPVAAEGKVYFVADDGFLYCLDASTGQLRWKFRGLPADRDDRTLLGNGRLISLWPARGGPVLRDGVIYFAAGLWPADGVFVHALDAETGKAIWSNTVSNHIPEANQDHGIAQYAGLAPQGYLAIVDDKLIVPCGAQLPAILNLKTGTLDSYNMGWGGRDGLPKGTWFVAGSGHYLCQSGDLYDLSRPNDEHFRDGRARPDFKSKLYTGGFTRIRIDPANQKDIGSFGQPVITANTLYENDGGITARDLTNVQLAERNEIKLPPNRLDDTYPDRFTAKFKDLWKLSSKLQVHIKSGRQLICAGPGVLAAVRIPAEGEQPTIEWQTSIEGTPHRLLAADGRLFAVTREGRIYAFGAGQPAKVTRHQPPVAPTAQPDGWKDSVADILKTTGITEGYAVVLGLESGRLVEQLVRQSDLYVIAIDPDASLVDELRQRLCDAGYYGARSTVRVGDPLKYPLPPYLASLIVSEHSASPAPGVLGTAARVVYPKLRPYGGTACLALGGGAAGVNRSAPAGGPFAGLTVRQAGDWTLFGRAGALPGAADWSHELANAAGTGASFDRFVKAPLGLLWFDASQEWYRKPGAAVVRVAGGRMLIKARKLYAVDVFTGRALWEASLPFPHAATDELVTAPDAIYVTGGKLCLVLDPATGRETRRIGLPQQFDKAWRNLRCWEDYLVATNGRTLLCVDRHTDKLRWQYECNRPALSVSVGGGRVYCAELLDPRRGEKEKTDVKTRAFDIQSGQLRWELARGSRLLYSEPLDLLVNGDGVYSGGTGNLVRALPKPPPSANRRPAANIPTPLFVIGDKLLWGTVQSFTIIDLKTGKWDGDRTDWVRRGCTTIRASEHLVTTRVRANAAYIDLDSRESTSLWNIRPACLNNLYPADGVLNAPNVLGGCTCNYTHTSQAYVPVGEIERASFGKME